MKAHIFKTGFRELDNTEVSSLPPAFFDLQRLDSLSLNDLSIGLLSSDIEQLLKLTSLSLRNSNLPQTLPVFPSELTSLESLMILDISENSLIDFPPQIASFNQLTTLSVRDNALTAVDGAAYAGLPLLKYFDLDDNQFTSFPSGIGLLSSLTFL